MNLSYIVKNWDSIQNRHGLLHGQIPLIEILILITSNRPCSIGTITHRGGLFVSLASDQHWNFKVLMVRMVSRLLVKTGRHTKRNTWQPLNRDALCHQDGNSLPVGPIRDPPHCTTSLRSGNVTENVAVTFQMKFCSSQHITWKMISIALWITFHTMRLKDTLSQQ